MTNPLISVCIPTYNGEKYILEALKSVVCQTCKNYELIISDDNSTDKTIDIVKAFIKNHPQVSVKLVRHKPSCVADNWNNCILHAQGRYIKFLFQDDYLEPSCLENLLNCFDINPNIAIVASKRNIIIEKNSNNNEKWINSFEDLQEKIPEKFKLISNDGFLLDNTFFKTKAFLQYPRNKIGEPSTIMFKKEIFDKGYKFNHKFAQMLDYEFYYRVLKKHKIYIINKKLVNFRLHKNQLTNINQQKQNKEHEKFYKILLLNFFLYLSVANKLRVIKNILNDIRKRK